MARYRQGTYDFVVDNSFTPFTMQEMLVPFSAYKEEYEKEEEAYNQLTEKADTFKYLAKRLESNPDSEAAKIYKGYADELEARAKDLSQNGLSMGNRRSLTNLKRRYQGEIGRLVTADTAMQEEKKLRRQMNAKDSSMLYAINNLDIDDFLDNNTPNLYSISGTELYTRGAAAGKTASLRINSAGDEGPTLNGYYRKWVERNGYSKESMDAFRANAAAIPELQQAADAILAERGVTENLTGNNYERARQSVLNGIIDGAIYAEKVSPVRDAGVMSAVEKDASKRAWESFNFEKQKYQDERAAKYIIDPKTGRVTGTRASSSNPLDLSSLGDSGGISLNNTGVGNNSSKNKGLLGSIKDRMDYMKSLKTFMTQAGIPISEDLNDSSISDAVAEKLSTLASSAGTDIFTYLAYARGNEKMRKSLASQLNNTIKSVKSDIKKAETLDNKRWSALLNMDKSDISKINNDGFLLKLGQGNTEKYTWAGVVSQHSPVGGSRVISHGRIGDDVSGSGLGIGLGFTSDLNLMSPWGNYSVESIDSRGAKDSKFLKAQEIVDLQYIKDRNGNYTGDLTPIGAEIEKVKEEYCQEHGLPADAVDDLVIQVWEVPNEHGSRKKGYAIAVKE